VTLLLHVAVGGAVGAVARYLVGGWIQRAFDSTSGAMFPWGTLSVNLIGCGLMGGLAVLLLDKGLLAPPMRTAILVGMLGAFTTWSSFGIETIRMVNDGQFQTAVIYVMMTNLGCLAAVWATFRLAQKFL
jgi:fluoride exporter